MKPRWRDVLPIHPAAQLLPRLPEEVLRVLGEDLKAHGLLHPIYIFREAVSRGRSKYSLLDGVSRLDAMELVGIDFEIDCNDRLGWAVTPGRTACRAPMSITIAHVDPLAFVLSVNLHRHHLTVEQKRDLIAKVLKARPSKSNPHAGMIHPYVAAGRVEKSGEVETLTTSIDTKARKQPSRKPATEKRRKDPDHLISRFAAEVRSNGLEIAMQIEAVFRPLLVDRLHVMIDEIELEAERWAKETDRLEQLSDMPSRLRRSAP